jgi:preprotein translocase subunit YajC
MIFFISNAMAENGAAGEPGFMGFIPLILIFVLFYFLLIRPQAKRAKEHKQMVQALSKGDEVVTNGGLLGRLTDVEENFVTMEIADGVKVKVQRQSIMTLVPKGTAKGGKGQPEKENKKAEKND